MINRFASLLFVVIPYTAILGCSKNGFSIEERRDADTVYVYDNQIYTEIISYSDSIVSHIKKYDNPVIKENLADPSIIKASNGVFYLYSTETHNTPNVPIYKSIDLINWYFVGSAFDNLTRPKSFPGKIWAPDINYIDGKYVMYYSMSEWGGEWECGIGVAVSDYPYGPFKNYAVLFSSRDINVRNSIDPFFIENEEGKFLFWGSHHGIYGIRLSDDGLSVRYGAQIFQIAGKGGEGTYIHRHGNYYYLFVSIGTCCNGLSSSYHITYGRSSSLGGPYFDKVGRSMMEGTGSLLLKGNSFTAGTGHNAEFITDDSGDDWILYHGYLKSAPELNRIIFLDRVEWVDGWPVISNDSPSESSVIPYFKNNNN